MKKISPIVVNILAIGIEGSPIHIITLINKFPNLIINTNKLIGRINHFIKLKILNFLPNDVKIFFILLN